MTEVTQPEVEGAAIDRRNYGRFRVLGTLGAGGMGVVLAAHDPDLERAVALKILHPDSFGGIGGDHAARLTREARVMAQLAHPNVVTVYEVGAIEERIFLAMELVDGTTLRGWLSEQPRSWREIVDVFIAAGRGLVAAHDHGLVHRDFKPDNVLVGRDGRPRVTDFGLAASIGEGAIVSDDDAAPTTTASAVGTPAYMAPEQWAGRATDPRTDQFSFCVALWEALHGERPFRGTGTGALRDAVRRGELRAPTNRRVPRWLDAALRRGLALEPAARWPDLASLLTVLGRRRRRWWAIASGAAAGASVAAVALLATPRAAEVAPCAAVAAPFRALWSPVERVRIEHGFLATGGPVAAATWARIVPVIERWGERWVAMRREACLATEVRREQSAAMLDLRMSCLDDRRRELGGMLHAFATATPEVAAAALTGLGRLEPIARCADVVALTSVAPPPPAIAPQVEVLKAEVAEVAAAARVNRTGYRARAEQATAAARALGYVPLEAEALFALGTVHDVEGTFEDALRSFEAAAITADRCSDDRLRARAWIEATGIAGWSLRRGDVALRMRDLAAGALGRLREPGTLAILLHKHAAEAHLAGGASGEALREIEAAIARFEPTTEALVRAEVANFQGIVFGELRRLRDARGAFRQALALYEAELGGEDPRIAALSENLASVILLDGSADYAEVQRLQDRAISIKERVWGPWHPRLADSLVNRVGLFQQLQRFAEALPIARRIIAIRERSLPADHADTASAIIELAIVFAGLDQRAEAERTFERGIAMQARSLPDGHAEAARAHGYRAMNLLELHRVAAALRELDVAVVSAQRVDGGAAEVARWVAWQARAYVESGDPRRGLARADQALHQARAADVEIPHGGREAAALARWHRARALLALGRRADARAEARAAAAGLAPAPAADLRALRATIDRWATNLDRT